MAKKKSKSLLHRDLAIGRVTLSQRALLAKHLSVMLSSGMTINESISIASASSRGKLRVVLARVLKSVETGYSLADALRAQPKIFSTLFVNAVDAGEQSGTLVENLQSISDELEREKELISKIRSSLFYPAVVMLAAIVLGFVLSFVILPQITPIFRGLDVDLPFTTRGLLWVAEQIERYGWRIGVVFFGAIIGFFVLVTRKFMRPITHWAMLHIPVLKGVVQASNLSRFARTFAMLLKSGLPVDESLTITSEVVTNFYYKRALKKVAANVRAGTRISDNLERHESLFPVLVSRMVHVGEESGKFEDTLFYLARFYTVQVDQATKTLSTAIEPVLLLVIGSIVAFLALSIITPIYEITGNVQG